MKNTPARYWWLLLLVGLVAILWFASRDKVDPLWEEVDVLMASEIGDLHDHKDSVNLLFHQVHGSRFGPDEGFERLSDPFLPTMTWKKFSSQVYKTLRKRKQVYTSVPGVGSSTLIDRLTRFLTTDEDHIITITCAPAFELKLHEQYLGHKDATLVKFLRKAAQHPTEKYILVIDNLDKINPESFWGPELWKSMEDEDFQATIDGVAISFPPNFHIISIVHSGITAKHKLRDEHYRKIGFNEVLEVVPAELWLYLQGSTDSKQLSHSQLKNFMYTFMKSNQILSNRFGKDHRLGQWSSYRKKSGFKKVDELLNVFVHHIKSLRPDELFTKDELSAVAYAIKNDGLQQHSSWLAKKLIWLEKRGFLTEFIVGLSFLLLTGLVSLYLLKRREKLLSTYIRRLGKLIVQYESGEGDFDSMITNFEQIKAEVDQLAMTKKINYNEATFFYSFFDNKVRKIEMSKEIRAQFEDLLSVFLEDDFLSRSEYEKLIRFLERISKKTSSNDYRYYIESVEKLRDQHAERW